MNGLEILKASVELRGLRTKELILQRGKGRSTYYIPNFNLPEWKLTSSDTSVSDTLEAGAPVDLSEPVPNLSEPVPGLSEPVQSLSEPVRLALVNQFPADIQERLLNFPKRTQNKKELEIIIIELCTTKPCSITELATLLQKNEKYLLFNFIKPLRENGALAYTFPEMPNHPQQAYMAILPSQKSKGYET